MSQTSISGNGSGSEVGNRQPQPRTGVLAGLRVADFCWMGVGAVATRMLADFGAEVIKIEDRIRIDSTRRMPMYKDGASRTFGEELAVPDPNASGLFNNYNRNKLSVTINMRTNAGKALARRLIAQSSVVTENFAPGVMERWGLTYDALREIVPDIIFARMSGFGHAGPYSAYRSYGPVIQAACGLTHVAGLPDREPSGWGFSYMDNMASYFNSAAVLLAVLHREQTGDGGEVSCAAVDIGVNLLGQFFLDASVNDRPTRRPGFPTGNRLEHPAVAPHGVYRCAGDDRWVAITVFDDEEWRKLVKAMDSPAWADDDRFATMPARFAHQDELDDHLTAWTSTRDPHEVMSVLQTCGVRAGAVQDGQDLNERDPHLAHRGTFFELDHPVIGPARFEGFPTQFSRSRPDHWRSAPLLGEDNDYVLGQILGVPEDERRELEAAGVI